MALTQLIYVSRAHHDMEENELRELAKEAWENNKALGVTGILCYGEGKFLQLLEGTRRSVNRLYHVIANDKRHSNLELVSVATVGERLYSRWSMRVMTWREIPGESTFENTLFTFSGNRTFNPLAMSKEQILGLLRALRDLPTEPNDPYIEESCGAEKPTNELPAT